MRATEFGFSMCSTKSCSDQGCRNESASIRSISRRSPRPITRNASGRLCSLENIGFSRQSLLLFALAARSAWPSASTSNTCSIRPRGCQTRRATESAVKCGATEYVLCRIDIGRLVLIGGKVTICRFKNGAKTLSSSEKRHGKHGWSSNLDSLADQPMDRSFCPPMRVVFCYRREKNITECAKRLQFWNLLLYSGSRSYPLRSPRKVVSYRFVRQRFRRSRSRCAYGRHYARLLNCTTRQLRQRSY